MTAPLKYLLITVNVVALEKVCFSDKENPQAVFFAFLKYILNFKHLPKKGDPHSRCVSGNTDCEKYG